MHGCGDNLHERALVRDLMRRHRVWLETPWPSIFHDLVGDRLLLVNKGSSLRTQAKNARRQADHFTRMPVPRGARALRVWYSPEHVRAQRSVLGAMLHQAGCGAANSDFRMPVPQAWRDRADEVIRRLSPAKPILVYRPLVERTEWSGCAARNPDYATYEALIERIRGKYFVVSVADLEPGKEWMVGPRIQADAEFHAGELEFEVLAALVQQAALVFASPGFAVILAQAVGTPSVCVFGGYEAGYSFSLGAKFTPHLAIEPINPCPCFKHNHPCDKTIDLPAALASLDAFSDRRSSLAA